MERPDLAKGPGLVDGRPDRAVRVADAVVVLHRRRAVAEERQEIRETLLHGQPRCVTRARVLQHLEGASAVLDRFVEGIQGVRSVGGGDQRARGSGGVRQPSCAVEMVRDSRGVPAGRRVELRQRVGDPQVQPLPPDLRDCGGERVTNQLMGKAPRELPAPGWTPQDAGLLALV